MAATLLIILGCVLAIAGVFACLVPVLPGPLLSYSALIILSWAKHWEPISVPVLIVLGFLTVVFSLMDNFIPAISAKRTGASRSGIWGSIIGMIIGMFIFPPFGIFLGSFAGAMVGEIFSGAKGKKAISVGWGVFVGNMLGAGLKLAFSLAILLIYLIHLF